MSFGIPTRITMGPVGIRVGLAPDIGPEGLFRPRDSGVGQLPDAFVASITTRGCEDGVTRGWVPLQLMEPILMIPMALRE